MKEEKHNSLSVLGVLWRIKVNHKVHSGKLYQKESDKSVTKKRKLEETEEFACHVMILEEVKV